MDLESRMYELAQEWRESGLSKKAFCEHHGMKVHQLYYWERKQRTVTGEQTSKDVKFFSLPQQPSIFGKDNSNQDNPITKVLSIELPNGIKIDFY